MDALGFSGRILGFSPLFVDSLHDKDKVLLRMFGMNKVCEPMIGEKRQSFTDEPVEFEK